LILPCVNLAITNYGDSLLNTLNYTRHTKTCLPISAHHCRFTFR